MTSIPDREEIDDEYKWDLRHVYPSVEEWEADYESVRERLDDLRAYEGRIDDGDALRRALETYEELTRTVETLHQYAMLQYHTNVTDEAARDRFQRARSLQTDLENAAGVVRERVGSAGDAEIEAFLDSTDGLERFEHYLSDLLRGDRGAVADATEETLSQLEDVLRSPGDVYQAVTDGDFTPPTVESPGGEAVEVTRNSREVLIQESDRAFRRAVYERYFEELRDYEHVLATAYETKAKTAARLADLRGYESVRAWALDRQPDRMGPRPNLPTEVHDVLLDGVRANLDPMHRYYERKREHLGVDTLRMWDHRMPMADAKKPDVPYDEARERVVEAVAPLGEAYQDRVAELLAGDHVDVYETAEKTSALPGYTVGGWDADPYVFLNYKGTAGSMFRLAHELGHAMHWELSSRSQPPVYSDFSRPTSEIPSKFHEVLLANHLLDAATDEGLRQHVLNRVLWGIESNLYYSARWATFTHRTVTTVEDGEPLSVERLDEQCRRVHETFLEPFEIDDHTPSAWLNRYLSEPLYHDYPYVIGTVVALALGRDLDDGSFDRDEYRSFLRKGSSRYPMDLLDELGVDLRTTDPVNRAVRTYESYLDRLVAELDA